MNIDWDFHCDNATATSPTNKYYMAILPSKTSATSSILLFILCVQKVFV